MAKGQSRGWKMAISIGGAFLIPIRLDGIAREAKSNLHEYHKDDMGAGGRKRYCKTCNKELAETDIIKGLEVSKGQVVTFTAEELDSLPLATTKNIEIDRFIQAKELNPLTYETTYYLAPDEVGIQAFNLFAEGLKKLNKVAIGKVAIRQRESLCVIRPHNGGLIMSTLYWAGEMKDAPQVPKAQVTDVQLDLIKQVIGKFSKPLNYADYSDKYLDTLNQMAQDKLTGKIVTIAAPQAQPQQNLEDALKALVEK